MSSTELALRLRAFLIRAEKGTALLLNYEFDRLQKDILEFLQSIGPENSQAAAEIDELVNRIQRLLARRTVRFSKIVGDVQKKVITAGSRAIVTHLQLDAKVFIPDKEALQKLIDRRPSSVYFQKLTPLVVGEARAQLAEGFAAGESSEQIAKRINDVAKIGKFRAMTIARTETNEAFRSATREMYSEAGREKYVWMAVLDARTCLTCWSLHGRIFSSSIKVFSHPRCRCVLVPFMPGENITTGAERFMKLEPGFQKQILGPTRFDLINSGSVQFEDLTGYRNTDDGRDYFIRNLADL